MDVIVLEWFHGTPPFTRSFVLGSVALLVLLLMSLTTPYDYFFSVDKVFHEWQLHRLVTAFLYLSPLGLEFITRLFVLLRLLQQLELGARHSRDFGWFLLVICSMIVAYSTWVHNEYNLSLNLNAVLLYVASQRNANMDITVFGLLTFSVIYLPWFNVAWAFLSNYRQLTFLLLNGNPSGRAFVVNTLVKYIALGHVYVFASDILPNLHDGRIRLVRPPWYWGQ